MQTRVETVSTPDQRVDRVVQGLTVLPRRQVRGLFDQGCVLVNGRTCTQPFERVSAGDRVEVRYEPSRRYRETKKPWRDPAFQVVFEDEHLIVVNKEAGFLTVPTPRDEIDTLIDRVSAYLIARGRGVQAHVAHRLDRGVSGLLVFGKSARVSSKLRDQFELRKPQRLYVAIVAGVLDQEEGTFRSHLATAKNLDRYSKQPGNDTQLAITHYRVQQRLNGATLVHVWLETGRRNQIRVHFAEAGHPVLGDTRYASRLATHPRWQKSRLALHAMALGFEHPVTGEAMSFESTPPTAISRFAVGAGAVDVNPTGEP